jgi:hypothetical protein
MFSIKIKNILIDIPNRLSEVPLYKGIEIISMFKENKSISFNEKIAIISTLSNIDPVIFKNVKEESIDKIYTQIKHMFSDHQIMLLTTFLLNDILYGVMDFKKMIVLEFIDIELNLKHNNNYDNIHILLSIFCRKIIEKNNNIKNILNNIKFKLFFKNIVPQIYKKYKIEEYSDKNLENAEIFLNKMDLESALGIYYQYIDFRSTLMKDFSLLFENIAIPDEDKDQYDEEPIYKKPRDFDEDYGLYNALVNISSSVMEIDYWKKKPVREFLLYLTYLKDKKQYEVQQQNYRNKINIE